MLWACAVVVYLVLSVVLIEVLTNAFVINLAILIGALIPLGLCGLKYAYNRALRKY